MNRLNNETVVQAIQDAHARISAAIDKGYVVDAHGKHINIYNAVDGFNYLGNVIQGNADSVNPTYYERLPYLYRKVLGMSSVHVTKHHTTVPSALNYFSTSLRDPAFYGMYKTISTHWNKYVESSRVMRV